VGRCKIISLIFQEGNLNLEEALLNYVVKKEEVKKALLELERFPMDDQSRKNIEEAEKQLGHATGNGQIERGECPIGAISPVSCMFCSFGHMLDCHYPYTCEEANCSHYQAEANQEPYYEGSEI
jgi:hypothetical protein